ncbi:3,4-dioxygenase subunit beta [Nocardioides sp. Bht2]|uniref:dioxygenase family protein n=1 Tax=Nocardioides sp. Bht2 TaxID=3392297 RepID=UPI0039B63B85
MTDAEIHDHDRGLQHDLPKLAASGFGRRRLLGLFGAAGAAAVLSACGDDGSSGSNGTSSSSSAGGPPAGGPNSGGAPPGGGMGGDSSVEVAEGEIPEETAGPYPGDGSNGVNVLSENGVVRSDIRSSFGAASGVAAGVPITVKLRVLDLNGDESAPLAGAAIYLWHCDRNGDYSMYSEAIKDENYLRGVQETDAQGRVEFTTVFPAAYSGRYPHMHFEVYPSLAEATSSTKKLRTSQLALPEDVCAEVYGNAEGYSASLDRLTQTPLDSDGIFADGYSLQMAKVTGSITQGYVATLNVPI